MNEMDYIPYGHQYIDKEDINEVLKVLKSDWLTQGPKVREFEEALSKYAGARYAVAVSSGTAGLHLACLAGGIKKDELVITTPITFAATANAVLYAQGLPAFVDIEPKTLNIAPRKIKDLIYNKLSPRPPISSFTHPPIHPSTHNPRAIIVVHFAGLPCKMQGIYKIAKRHNLIVIEDACHALGASYREVERKGNGKTGGWVRVGSCRHSDMTVFSFHPVKSITTAEGGAILTNRKDLYEKLIMLRNHGITRNPDKWENGGMGIWRQEGKNPIHPNWYYEMQYLGFNYRLTDLQSALGISQLKKLDRFIEIREEIACIYNDAFQDLQDYVELPYVPSHTKSSWHLYVIRLKGEKKVELKRKEIFEYLRENGIGVQVHYLPVYWHPFYKKLGYTKGLCPLAEDAYRRIISLPIYPALKKSQIKRVIRVFKKAVIKFGK